MIFYEYKILFRDRDIKGDGLVRHLSVDPQSENFEKEFCSVIERANKSMKNLGRDGNTIIAQIYSAIPGELFIVMA